MIRLYSSKAIDQFPNDTAIFFINEMGNNLDAYRAACRTVSCL